MQVFNFVGGTAVTISEPISISSFVSFRHCEAGKIYREKKKKKRGSVKLNIMLEICTLQIP